MIKHAKPKNLVYYLKRLAVLLAVAAACWQMTGWCKKLGNVNVEKILNESELKNQKFAAKVKKIEQGALSAYFMEEHSNPIVSVNFIFRNSGSAHEAENKQGLALLTSELLTEGAGKYDSQTFKNTAEENGVKLGFSVSADDFLGALAFPKENQNVAEDLLRSALYEASLDENAVLLKKQQLLTALKMQSENPKQVLANKFKEDIFAGHPYARNSLGKAGDIQNISADEMRAFLQNSLAQDNLIVGIAGDLTESEAQNLLTALFGKLPEKSQNVALKKMEFNSSGEEYNNDLKTAQSLTHFVAKGTYRDSVDFYPLYLANYIFGESGLNSRLSKVIREKEGLTYGIYTYLTQKDAIALIEGGYSATPENFAKVQKLLLEEWQKIGEAGVTEDELAEAKKSLLNSFYLRFATIDGISDMLVLMQKYNLGLDFLDKRNDYIRQVSREEVNAAAKKYFSERPDFVNVGMKNIEEK